MNLIFTAAATLPSAPNRRPLLSRVAESLFWLGRYIERSETLARMLRVNAALLTDVGDLAPALKLRQWKSVVDVFSVADVEVDENTYGPAIASYMTFDPLNPGGLIAHIGRARENARAVRSEISTEMWKCLNQLYWSVNSQELKNHFEEQADEVWDSILNQSMMFVGIADSTLGQDQRWLFLQLGRSLERAMLTCRIIESRYTLLQEMMPNLETPLRNIQWMALLRLCCSIEAYRREYAGDLKPLKVIEFLLLEAGFPRSVLYNATAARDAVAGIRALTSPDALEPAERVLGRHVAMLDYASVEEIERRGVVDYLTEISEALAESATLVQQTYFMK